MNKRYTKCCRDDVARESYTSTILRGDHAGETFESHRPTCATCHDTYPTMVYITIRNAKGGLKTKCGGACLAGKISCDCKCEGRCHGAGRCQCGEVAA